MSSGDRKLLAMLNGDIAGYSRLMAANEDATIDMLAAHRDSIGITIVANHGRLVDFTGDNFLAEFSSAIHALRCAIEIQHRIHAKYSDTPPEQRLNFRLGAHLGDVRIEGERIYGDAVNIASRLESLSEAGGICLSRQILDQISGQIDVDCEDLGEQMLKNIPHSIHAYRIPVETLMAEASKKYAQTHNGVRESVSTGGAPTIAVLPFANLSPDPGHAFLADGMTADIISGLSCDQRFSVISHTAVTRFSGDVADVRDVGEILRARYVVEGTVRHIGSRLRVSMALIDVESRTELWGNKIDRPLSDIFDVFDELVEAIVTALGSHLRMAEEDRLV